MIKKIILLFTILFSLIISVNAIEGAGVVNASGLNIRQSPTTNSNIITTIYNSQRVVVEYQDGEWYKINYQGTEGYVYSNYMYIMTIANGNYGNANPNCYAVNIRQQPTIASSKLATINSSDIVNIIGINSGWYKITTTSGITGYIRGDLLTITSASNAFKPTTSTTTITSTALKYIGVPYLWGGTSPNGFDCSGFVQYVFKQHGYYLNRTASAQYYNGVAISQSNLKPGDLVFFERTYATNGISHVGIYIGNNQFIHAGNSGVAIASLSENYYATRYYGACRVF